MRVPSGPPPEGFGSMPMPPYPPPPRKAPSRTKPLDFMVIVLLPWMVFSLVVSLFAFAYQEFAPLVWALVAASALLGLLFVSMGGASGRAAQLALGFLILSSVGLGVPVGVYIQSTYTAEYYRIDGGAAYQKVSPAAPGASYADASVVEFDPGATVGVQQSLGYMKMGTVYCVAPILGPGAAASPSFWAAGVNCCSQRGGFSCGGQGGAEIRNGVRLDDGAGNFADAARMASAGRGGEADPGGRVFLRWTADAAAYKQSLWDRAVVVAGTASAVQLVGSGGAGLLLSRCAIR